MVQNEFTIRGGETAELHKSGAFSYRNVAGEHQPDP